MGNGVHFRCVGCDAMLPAREVAPGQWQAIITSDHDHGAETMKGKAREPTRDHNAAIAHLRLVARSAEKVARESESENGKPFGAVFRLEAAAYTLAADRLEAVYGRVERARKKARRS